MAGELIGALRVSLGLDSSQFESGTKKARRTAETNAKAIQKALDGVKNRFDAVVAGFGVSELVAAGKRALDYASSLGEVAQQLGVTTKDLQQYRYAASQVGIEQEEMDKSLAKLTRTIGEAKAGSKAQATTFRELGVSIQDANGRVYTAGELMPKLADALSKIKDPATRARIEVDLFGKAGQKLDTMLSGGGAAINQLTQEAARLGVILSDQQIQKADATADKLAALKQVLEARLAGTVSDNADAILKIADALGTLASKALEAVQNFSNFRNLRGFNLAGSTEAAKNLFSTQSGRNALRNDTAAKLDANSRKRVNASNSPAMNAELDREFKALTNIMNRVNQADRLAQDRARTSPRPAADGALPVVAPSARTPRARAASGPSAAEIEEKFQEDLRQLRQEQLQNELSLTTDAEKRADLQSQLLTEEYEDRKARIENDKHFNKEQKNAQVALLKRLYGMSGEGDSIVVGGGGNSLATGITRERDERLAQEAYDLQAAQIGAQQEDLRGQLEMARSSDERRRIVLELLDLEYQLRDAKLDQIIKTHDAGENEAKIAQLMKGRLADLKAQDTANVNRQNLGPMGKYLDSLPQTIGEMNDALEAVAVRGIQSVEDGLMSIIDGTKSVGAAFREMASSIISDLLRLAIQQSITMPLANMLFPNALGGSVGTMQGPTVSGGGGFAGMLLGLGKMFAGSIKGGSGLKGVNTDALSGLEAGLHSATLAHMGDFAMPMPKVGFANGGTIGGFPGIDKNVLSINGIPRVRVSANERIRVEPNSVGQRVQEKALHIGSMVFPGVTNAREAREAGRQAASALQSRLAAAKRQGF